MFVCLCVSVCVCVFLFVCLWLSKPGQIFTKLISEEYVSCLCLCLFVCLCLYVCVHSISEQYVILFVVLYFILFCGSDTPQHAHVMGRC